MKKKRGNKAAPLVNAEGKDFLLEGDYSLIYSPSYIISTK